MATKAQPALWRDTMKAGALRSGAMLGALVLLAATILLVTALASYHPSDPSLNTAAAGPARNWLGTPGAYIADLLYMIAGWTVWLLVPLVLLWAVRLWRDSPVGRWKAMLRNVLIGMLLIGIAIELIWDGSVSTLSGGYGGIIGMGIAAALRWATHFIGNVQGIWWTERGLAASFALVGIFLWARGMTIRRLPLGAVRLPGLPRIGGPSDLEEEDEDDVFIAPEPPMAEVPPEPAPRKVAVPQNRPDPVIADRTVAPSAAKQKKTQGSLDLRDNYSLPPLDLLKPAPADSRSPVDKAALQRNARLLESVLDDFKVKGSIVEVRPGPVVTMYELEPESGVKASRVVSLADDIARNMSAISARVATIPGRSVIGIELPNARREMVNLHELIGSQTFEDQSAQLPLVLGKNIAGDAVIADLAPMPHLLVAGTTGSGKSVGLNCMILSLLYRLTPDQCRLIMIDPKMLELSMYKDIPHLLADVVTDPPKAVRALKWAVEQMEERYRMMASLNVRSLGSFNDKVRQAKAKGQKLGRKVQTGWEDGKPIYEEEELDLIPLPQIVIVVDELADLMMTAGKEVEILIQRLAQKARAAGIHLIMATQRPSVDVITGVIKANLPTRISFHVTSKIDSRTILGEQGAEQLLGKGDMLYMPGGKQLARVHGPFVTDEEVEAVADFWRAQGQPDYISAVTEEPEEGSFALDGASADESPEERQYSQARQLVAQSQKASTSWLQRQMRIGYNSAARLIERMEGEGLVSKPDHVGRREVLMDEEGRPTG
ncbi:S-DNA-T family DNA segregation ATPase FtsK/SpoIIIE [Stakelama sediminis]|uniref:DNA translocase FtsK n=1 Tax=Stakelama sediminis TaxID=463200 RepID=A0A840Z0G3_9SPHN|nr:S-DNA-T family DNA segregation ATPase FtsK/SpoIIIE [Stakelama sediminis]